MVMVATIKVIPTILLVSVLDLPFIRLAKIIEANPLANPTPKENKVTAVSFRNVWLMGG